MQGICDVVGGFLLCSVLFYFIAFLFSSCYCVFLLSAFTIYCCSQFWCGFHHWTWFSRVSSVELANQEFGVGDMLRRFPSVILWFMPYGDSILQLSPMGVGIQNVFYFVLLFSIDFNRGEVDSVCVESIQDDGTLVA